MWPTWADIIAYDQGIEYHNYALPGLGNVGIQHRIVEADIKHTFTDDDIILIMWTGWCREDRVKHSQWANVGSVLDPHNNIYDRKFLKKYWDYSNDIVKNSTAIISANRIYKNNIRWQGTGLPLFFTEGPRSDDTPEDKMLIDLYKDSMPAVDNVNTFKNDFDMLAFGAIEDCHPDVNDHMLIVKNHIYKKMNLTINKKTEKRFAELHNRISKNYKNQRIQLSSTRRYINNLITNDFSDIFKVMNIHLLIQKD
jgi:hypothetical protein